MKKTLYLLSTLTSLLHGAEEEFLDLNTLSAQNEEIVAFDPTFLQAPTSPTDMQLPELKEPFPQKNPFTAACLSALFPGLGHLYLGDNKTAATLMGSMGVGIAAYPMADSTFALPICLQTVSSYSIYAAYRDARSFNQGVTYRYKMPTDSFADLSYASFNYKILKKPEVWGGLLGFVAVATGVSYLAYGDTEAKVASVNEETFSPLIAFPVGISEEALFRGFIQSSLLESWGPATSITVSSLLFGAAHIPNALLLPEEDRNRYYSVSLPLITGFGAYFGWLTYKNHSLKESVALHSWYDFTIFALGAVANQAAATGRPGFALALEF